MNRKLSIRVTALLFAAIAGFAPAAFSAEQGLVANQAACDTCCPQEGSTCIIGNNSVANSWHKATDGPCKPPADQ